jgi:EAL domain-containing protein (putative c-di-GMP-specific phosphodiesterase class I)
VYLNACHPRCDARALAGAISATRSAGFDLDVVVELEGATIFDGADGARMAVEPLLAIGAGVAVAGFGAGRSPLTRLRELPVRALVIDPSIVSDGYFEIIEPLAEVGRHLGVAVIATGVDTAEALERVRESGCPFAEGAALGSLLAGVGAPPGDG